VYWYHIDLTGFEWIRLDFIGFDWISLDLTGFDWLSGLNWFKSGLDWRVTDETGLD